MGTRLVSYNILSGGTGRADPIAEVLLGQRADIVAIHEADDAQVLNRLASRLSMQFVLGECIGGRVALFSRYTIVESYNIGLLNHSTMPVLDALIRTPTGELYVRAAHLTEVGEADRMAARLREIVPMVMLMSYDPPAGLRVIDGQISKADRPVPQRTHVPIRQIDEVLIRPDVRVKGTWIEQDRLAYYASDHLPAGAEIELG